MFYFCTLVHLYIKSNHWNETVLSSSIIQLTLWTSKQLARENADVILLFKCICAHSRERESKINTHTSRGCVQSSFEGGLGWCYCHLAPPKSPCLDHINSNMTETRFHYKTQPLLAPGECSQMNFSWIQLCVFPFCLHVSPIHTRHTAGVILSLCTGGSKAPSDHFDVKSHVCVTLNQTPAQRARLLFTHYLNKPSLGKH